MSFYLQKNNGNKIFITDAYLREKLIDISKNDSTDMDLVNLNTSSTDEGIRNRLNTEFTVISIEDCIKSILNEIKNPDDLSLFSSIITMDRTHIIAIVYLLQEKRINRDDLERIIKARSNIQRSEILISYLWNIDSKNVQFYQRLYDIFTKSERVQGLDIDKLSGYISNIKKR